jgi:dihydroorotate dehydrogenase (fumarate)
MFDLGADLVELNLGCPNVWQGDDQKPIACFIPPLVTDILDFVEQGVGAEARVAVKISPFSNPGALADVARTIAKSALVKAVTAVNTFPNAFSFGKDGKPAITPGGGFAGMAGRALKPIGLGQVRRLRALLPDHIQIIGVGGIDHGLDVLEYRTCGASAVQVATAYLEREDERIFGEILSQMVDATEESNPLVAQ